MITIPRRERHHRTSGSKAVGDYLARHDMRPVAVYIPVKLHTVLTKLAIEAEASLQDFITKACESWYGEERELPPLVAPTRAKLDPHKIPTWYANIELHKRMKVLAVEVGSSVQQLILSALVEYAKDSPEVKALGIKTGYVPYSRTPSDPPQRVKPKSTAR